MRVGKQLVFLGSVDRLDFESGGCRHSAMWDAGGMGLFCNFSGTKLFLLPLGRMNPVTPPDGARTGKKMFATWAKRRASTAYRISIPRGAEELSVIGSSITILYTSDKWVSRPRRYVHDFETRTKLFVDRTSDPRTWGIVAAGGKRLVTARGIVA